MLVAIYYVVYAYYMIASVLIILYIVLRSRLVHRIYKNDKVYTVIK